jgi:anhydro-N-acetylmuramic acid kinase
MRHIHCENDIPFSSRVTAQVNQESVTIVSIMSGTSVDSIDIAVCEMRRKDAERIGVTLVDFSEHAYSCALRQRILKLFRDREGSLQLCCSLNFEIAEAFAAAVLHVFGRMRLSSAEVAAIASHGQTVYHIPLHAAAELGCVASTLQLGEPAVIAERTGCCVITDFRSADVAVGGNGAPLVPFADWHLFSQPERTVVVHNIGGIANCTVLPAGAGVDDVVAFDTGPGNVLIDLLVERFFSPLTFDRDGAIAARGKVIAPLLDKWMKIPFISLPPPKSTGRELFGPQLINEAIEEFPSASPEDLIATATCFTARSFAKNLEEYILPSHRVDAIYLAGGGALNPTLRRYFQDELERRWGRKAPWLGTTDELGIPVKTRECVAFAVLGYARLLGIPANVPRATGASRRVLLGSFTEPTSPNQG